MGESRFVHGPHREQGPILGIDDEQDAEWLELWEHRLTFVVLFLTGVSVGLMVGLIAAAP